MFLFLYSFVVINNFSNLFYSSYSFNSSTLSIPSTTPLSSSYLNHSNTTYSTYYSTCCVLTYNMFTAYAEAATLQLKRKTQFNKLLHVSGHPDMRSICYLILMAFFYWGVMIRAAVATNITTTTQTPSSTTTTSHVAELNTKTMFYSNLTAETTTIPHNSSNGIRAVHGEGGDPPLPLLGNSSLKLPISLLTSDDTLTNYQRRLLMRREAANVPDFDEDDSSYHDDELDEYEILINNKSALFITGSVRVEVKVSSGHACWLRLSFIDFAAFAVMEKRGNIFLCPLQMPCLRALGKYIGAPCNNSKCESTLLHVVCEKDTNTCGCEKNYPVQLGLTRGCDKPKKLGEQCFYDETCQYNDENSLCVQVRHNAMCQCAGGFHSVSYTKPTRRVFCTQDIDELNSDLPTLLGVCIGIGVLAGLICMVLHLFSKTKYPRHRNFGDANLPPPIMYSSETGIPLTVQSGRPSSRSSIRSSGGSIGSYGNRRSSTGGVGGNNSATAGSKGILVSTSRTGAARSAAILLISCHLTTLSKQTAASRVSSRQTSGAGCSANSRDNLDENGSDPGSRSCDSTLSMTRHLQKQLNHQRHLLSFELSPAKTKNHDRVRALLGLNGIDNYRSDDDALNSLDNGLLEIGALPTPASETPRFAVNIS
ncbi:hypothetical protein CVS40_6784 [Lucilia cuprina]|nr:hypothetical protein CVS40_6784 [Lucilia cuprina]